MSEDETQPEEKKQQTATQLFASYMRTVEQVRSLTRKLNEKLETALLLSKELTERFGIHVSGSKPQAPRPAQPITAPRDEGAGAGDEGYKPPAQYHADATQLANSGSAEVAEIRRESGLTSAEEDSEALAAAGTGTMEALQRTMKGQPTVVPAPGEHQENRGAPPVERSNAEGGPVRQGPVEEEE